MKLSALSAAVPNSQLTGEIEISALAYNSREVIPGGLFVALTGAKSDGHDFIPEATRKGAVALVVSAVRAGWYAGGTLPTIVVPDTRKALPWIASAFYGEPSRKLQLIGVTGTNGKTTTNFMIESILRNWGDRTGLIGTLGAMINGKSIPLDHTTPESPDLQQLFAEMVEQGVKRATIEVSSEGAVQERTTRCAFDIGVFTNLTQDHLNTHGTMEAYFAQKLRLFTEYPDAFPDKPFSGVINGDDPYGVRIIEALEAAGRPYLRYSMTDETAQLRAEIVEVRPNGTDFNVYYRPSFGSTMVIPISLKMGGLFNVANAMAAIGVCLLFRLPHTAIQHGLEELTGVPGRFEVIDTGEKEFSVVVDYAHTSDGLENLLRSARALNPTRLICVFGCGGDRDVKKRPIMGKIVVEMADLAIVTSDNPRSEKPEAIIAEILTGIDQGESNGKVMVEADRHLAIQKAICELAQPGDLIVIAGKGHESGQQFADHKIPFDDRQVAREALAQCA